MAHAIFLLDSTDLEPCKKKIDLSLKFHTRKLRHTCVTYQISFKFGGMEISHLICSNIDITIEMQFFKQEVTSNIFCSDSCILTLNFFPCPCMQKFLGQELNLYHRSSQSHSSDSTRSLTHWANRELPAFE